VTCNPKGDVVGRARTLGAGLHRAIHRIIDEETDVPAPDVYTNPSNHGLDDGRVQWIKVITYRASSPASLFPWGDPRGAATLRRAAGVYTVREAAKALGVNLKGASAAIQGLRQRGQFAHKRWARTTWA